MRRKTRILILVCLLLLVSLFSTGITRAWYCDGRVCSTAAECCCLAGESQLGAHCRLRATGKMQATICEAGCKCKLTIKAAPRLPAGLMASFVFPVPVSAPASPVFAYLPPPATLTILRHIEMRGPPRPPLLFATLSLRAPPVA